MFANIAPSSDSCSNHEEGYRVRWEAVETNAHHAGANGKLLAFASFQE